MTGCLRFCGAVAALASATVLAAQPVPALDAQKVMAELQAATNERDPSRLLRRATDGIVMISKNGETIVGRSALAAYVDRMIGAGNSLKAMRSAMSLAARPLALGERSVLVYGTSVDNYVFSSGFTLAMTTLWSATMVWEAGEWKIAAVHFSFDLFDNPLLDHARWLALAAAAAGLVSGLLAGGAFHRLSRTLRKSNTGACQHKGRFI